MFVAVGRAITSFLVILFAVMAAPAAISAPSNFLVLVGVLIWVGALFMAATTASTPVFDSVYRKIEALITKG